MGVPDDAGLGAGHGSASTPLIQRPEPRLGYLLFISALFMLNAPLFFTLNTGMDMYGFYTLEPVSAKPLPAALSTLLSCVMVVAAYVLYRWLCGRRAWFSGDGWGPFTRGAVLSGAPVLLAFAPSIVLTSVGGKPTLIAVAGLTAGSLCVTHALRDPEMNLDPDLARKLFHAAIAAILVFLALSIVGMMMLYYVEQMPASGNLLWKWDYEWEDLGYPREQFQQRQREALTAFTLTGSGFMIVVLGGSMLGAILRWAREPEYVEQPSRRHRDAPEWAAQMLLQLESLSPSGPGEAEYVAVFNGYEVGITGSQYESLVGGKDELLQDAELIVDKAAGDVFLRTGGKWTRLDFRVGDRTTGIRSGPFSLLCIYARNPGRRFANGELRTILTQELGGRDSFNVRDFISQLQRRRPRIRVERDETGSFLHDAVRVCHLDHRQSPGTDGGPTGPRTTPDPTPQ